VGSTSEMPHRARLVVKTRKKRGIYGCVHMDSDFVSVSVSFIHGRVAFGSSAGLPLFSHINDTQVSTGNRLCSD
jgi:hypothetical protein